MQIIKGEKSIFSGINFAPGEQDIQGDTPEYLGRSMQRTFTLEYWIDDGWYVGGLKCD